MRGRAEPGGDFVVSDVVWPGIAPQPERPLMDTDKYVALVSGLQLADRKADMMQVRLEGCQSCQGSFSCMECTMACHLYALSGEGPHARWSAACSSRTARQISCGRGVQAHVSCSAGCLASNLFFASRGVHAKCFSQSCVLSRQVARHMMQVMG